MNVGQVAGTPAGHQSAGRAEADDVLAGQLREINPHVSPELTRDAADRRRSRVVGGQRGLTLSACGAGRTGARRVEFDVGLDGYGSRRRNVRSSASAISSANSAARMTNASSGSSAGLTHILLPLR